MFTCTFSEVCSDFVCRSVTVVFVLIRPFRLVSLKINPFLTHLSPSLSLSSPIIICTVIAKCYIYVYVRCSKHHDIVYNNIVCIIRPILYKVKCFSLFFFVVLTKIIVLCCIPLSCFGHHFPRYTCVHMLLGMYRVLFVRIMAKKS